MNLIYEENGRHGVEETSALCPLNDVSYILHTARYGRESIERRLQTMCYDLRKGGLPDTGRSPKNER